MLTSNNPTAPSSVATISQHFHELKEEIVSFNESFATWLEDKRRLIHDDKNVYLKTLAEEHDAAEALKKQHTQLLQLKQELQQTLESEQKEFDQGMAINEELRVQQALLADKVKQLNARLDHLNQSNERETTILASKEKLRDAMNQRNHQLVNLYQEHLGLCVEPLDSLWTRFTFTHIDPDNWTRPFTMIVSVGAENVTYEVHKVDPPLPGMAQLQQELNETGDFFTFLRAVRKQFKALILQ